MQRGSTVESLIMVLVHLDVVPDRICDLGLTGIIDGGDWIEYCNKYEGKYNE